MSAEALANVDRQAFAREQVEDGEGPKSPTIRELVRDKVHAPSVVAFCRRPPLLTMHGGGVTPRSLFDGFPSSKRDRFAQLWGRMFHLYCADLMRFNYPTGPMNALEFEVGFNAGAADGVLDFGSDVIVFEFKGSLLIPTYHTSTGRGCCKQFLTTPSDST